MSGEPCEKEHSTCNGRNEMCIGRGPAWEVDDHGFKSNEIIARRQSDKAQSLWQDDDSLDITGDILSTSCTNESNAAHISMVTSSMCSGRFCLETLGACSIVLRNVLS